MGIQTLPACPYCLLINTESSNICVCSKSSRPIELRVEASGVQALIYASFQSRITRSLWFESTMVPENVRAKAFLQYFGGAVFFRESGRKCGARDLGAAGAAWALVILWDCI